LNIVATTTLVGDVVRQVAGDRLEVSVLLPVGADPHTFQPTPRDVARVAQASVIFASGAGLEEFLQPLIDNAGGEAPLVFVSAGVTLLEAGEHAASEAHEPEFAAGDPHTWFDPNNVILWTQAIEKKLSEVDPANAAVYAGNTRKYQDELRSLDAWIQEQVAQVPPGNRKLVADHTSFTYFAVRYGFEQVGAIIPAYSTLAAPSAQELARLEDDIRALGVRAVFVEQSVNPALAQRVAQDTGIQLVPLFNGSLSDPGGPAATYLDFMRYNVLEIVKALR
jgi:ABC-type Zn uptake system ZnuABC Zn-binding protein ZnuA